MTKAEAIKKTQAHWRKMIQWAKKQNLKERLSSEKDSNKGSSKMEKAIKQSWFNSNCDLCVCFQNSCSRCPITQQFKFSCESMVSLWSKVYKSKTWGTWVKNAEEFYKKQLMKLK